ncbi:hypothetical protein [Nonomuraea sp. B19D2]|uniref:hypothetical protein n=1 Tax=Nonomuraea sp. B19D2 TaxID=3159561 RepID=UPI0032DB9DE4
MNVDPVLDPPRQHPLHWRQHLPKHQGTRSQPHRYLELPPCIRLDSANRSRTHISHSRTAEHHERERRRSDCQLKEEAGGDSRSRGVSQEFEQVKALVENAQWFEW